MAEAIIWRDQEAVVLPANGMRSSQYRQTGGTSMFRADSGANTMEVSLTPSASNTVVTIPDPGTATANAVLTEGTQTLGGTYDFSNTVTISAAANLVRTYTISGSAVNGQYYSRYLTSGGTAQEWRAGLNAAGGVDNSFDIYDQTNTTARIEVIPGGAIAFTGAVTMDAALTNTAASNQLVLSSGVNQLTLNSGTSAAARTYLVPDVGASANFVMTEGTQTIAGAKTFTSGLIQDGSSESKLLMFRTSVSTTGTQFAIDSSNNFVIQQIDAAGIKFRTNNLERVSIDSFGNFGIGTSSPNAKFQVQESTSSAGDFVARIINSDTSSTSGKSCLELLSSSVVNNNFEYLRAADSNTQHFILTNGTNNGFNVLAGSTGTLAISANNTGAVTLGPSTGNVLITFDGRYRAVRRNNSQTGTVNALTYTSSVTGLVAAITTLNGITSTTEGTFLYLINESGGTVTINNNSGSASSSNRIQTIGATSKSLGNNETAHFIYAGSRWKLINL